MAFEPTVEGVGKIIDVAGVAVIVGGVLIASAIHVPRALARDRAADWYRPYRQAIGRAILLGLEFLVAADIIRTVAVSPTFQSVGVLAIIVLIRTFLSIVLELEINGRWPWERREASDQR